MDDCINSNDGMSFIKKVLEKEKDIREKLNIDLNEEAKKLIDKNAFSELTKYNEEEMVGYPKKADIGGNTAITV